MTQANRATDGITEFDTKRPGWTSTAIVVAFLSEAFELERSHGRACRLRAMPTMRVNAINVLFVVERVDPNDFRQTQRIGGISPFCETSEFFSQDVLHERRLILVAEQVLRITLTAIFLGMACHDKRSGENPDTRLVQNHSTKVGDRAQADEQQIQWLAVSPA